MPGAPDDAIRATAALPDTTSRDAGGVRRFTLVEQIAVERDGKLPTGKRNHSIGSLVLDRAPTPLSSGFHSDR